MNEYLSIRETMAELKVCRATLHKYIRSGRLTAYRVGRLIRITRDDLKAFVESEVVSMKR